MTSNHPNGETKRLEDESKLQEQIIALFDDWRLLDAVYRLFYRLFKLYRLL